MELLALYLWLKLDALQVTAAVVAGVLTLVCTFGWFVVGMPSSIKSLEASEAAGRRVGKWTALPALLFASLAIALPSQKDAAILFGAHYAIKAAESPEGQKVVTLLRKRVNEYLDQALNEPEKK